MPTGKVKWFNAEKGFGFVTDDDGNEAFLHSSALAPEDTNLRPGTRIEYSVADSRRGPQVMSVKILDAAPSLAKNLRRPANSMVPVVEDLIRLLDESSNTLRRGRYPSNGKQLARVLRTVADEFDV